MNSSTINMNHGWKFFYGQPKQKDADVTDELWEPELMPKWTKATSFPLSLCKYDDSSWQDVRLPHDFVVERSKFSRNVPFSSGCLESGCGWYRKTFTLPENTRGSRVFLTFNGVYRDSQVWCNGDIAARELSGFNSFTCEITNALDYDGENCIAVFCDASEPEGWWYTGGGIYRDVTMSIVPRVCIENDSVYIKSESVDLETRDCDFTAYAKLDSAAEEDSYYELSIAVVDGDTTLLEKTTKGIVKNMDTASMAIPFTIPSATLWGTQNPHLYTAEVTLSTQYGTQKLCYRFAPKKLEYNSKDGMKLNGEPLVFRGACGHDDFAGVGVALNRAIMEFKLDRLIEMGCNSYRCSHNPPDPIFLDLCDEKGILVLDEIRWPGVTDLSMNPFIDMIKRDRNHPSIFAWSLCNEEPSLQGKEKGVRVFRNMVAKAKKYDDTRDFLLAINTNFRNAIAYHSANGFDLSLNGINYMMLRDFHAYENMHEDHPDMCFINTELCSVSGTRGYHLFDKNSDGNLSNYAREKAIWENEDTRGNLTCYGDCYPIWGENGEEAIKVHHGKPYMLGMFLWTGMDYRGETYPYAYPNVISPFGFIDYCGFFKDWAYYLQSVWRDEPLIHCMPSTWNLNVKANEEIKVYVISNCPEVELVHNGVSLGKKAKEKLDRALWLVPYQKGELKAIGYDKDGNVSCEHVLQTSGEDYAISLSVNRPSINADGDDCAIVSVCTVDKNGFEVTDSDKEINFEVSGSASIIGTGNGNYVSHENDKLPKRKLFKGKAIAIVQSGFTPETVTFTASAPGLKSAEINITIE